MRRRKTKKIRRRREEPAAAAANWHSATMTKKKTGGIFSCGSVRSLLHFFPQPEATIIHALNNAVIHSNNFIQTTWLNEPLDFQDSDTTSEDLTTKGKTIPAQPGSRLGYTPGTQRLEAFCPWLEQHGQRRHSDCHDGNRWGPNTAVPGVNIGNLKCLEVEVSLTNSMCW